jgi:hypothetical protein
VSDRQVNDGDEKPDADIWRYSLVAEGRLEHLSVNSEAAEYSPVVTASGALYFASTRDGGPGQGDIYRATPTEDGFDRPKVLGPAFNRGTGEWNLWVSSDESEIIFEASSRSTNVSESGDLYYSWRTPAGWTAPVPIASLNSAGSELMPRLHPDGDTLYYTTAPLGGHARIATANRWEATPASQRPTGGSCARYCATGMRRPCLLQIDPHTRCLSSTFLGVRSLPASRPARDRTCSRTSATAGYSQRAMANSRSRMQSQLPGARRSSSR